MSPWIDAETATMGCRWPAQSAPSAPPASDSLEPANVTSNPHSGAIDRQSRDTRTSGCLSHEVRHLKSLDLASIPSPPSEVAAIASCSQRVHGHRFSMSVWTVKRAWWVKSAPAWGSERTLAQRAIRTPVWKECSSCRFAQSSFRTTPHRGGRPPTAKSFHRRISRIQSVAVEGCTVLATTRRSSSVRPSRVWVGA